MSLRTYLIKYSPKPALFVRAIAIAMIDFFFLIQKPKFMPVFECILAFFYYQIKWRNWISTIFSLWLKKSVKMNDSKKSSSAKWILKLKIQRKNLMGRSNPSNLLGSRLIKIIIIVQIANCLIFSFRLI